MQTANSRRPLQQRNVGFVETPRGPVNGYVANRSSSGTKTNTPIMETPQSVSVIGAEQIRDQKPNKLDEVLRYTAGVRAGTFGADTRNDWWLIRGFKSDDIGLFLDGMQLFYTAYASWRLPPSNMERVEVLRGPSAVLYGGSSPSGIVNVISKMPPTEPIRYIETGVNNFGNAYVGFDVGGPVATQPQDGKLFYRVVGQVQNGGTQVNFTPDNNYFIAPSFTWKPDADTTFTVLASASKTDTRGINFLPYQGTVTNAPFGKIPTSFFVGDPSVDKFTREQEMLGYQFERNLTDDLTFRQNARFAHIDLTYRGYIGNGWDNINTGHHGPLQLVCEGHRQPGQSRQPAGVPLQHRTRQAHDAVRRRSEGLSDRRLSGLQLRHRSVDQRFQSRLWRQRPAHGRAVPQLPDHAEAGRHLRPGPDEARQLHAGAERPQRLGRDVHRSRVTPAHIAQRDDSKFSGRAGLIYNFDNGIAPYVSYATSYNPVIGLNAPTSCSCRRPASRPRSASRSRRRALTAISRASVFDLKRQNVSTTDRQRVPCRTRPAR